MRCIMTLAVACGLLSAMPTSSPAQVEAEARTVVRNVDRERGDRDDDNRWRYRRHNGRWWYWTPDRSWVYWSGGAWVPYRSGGYVVGGGYYRGSPAWRYDYRGYRYDDPYRYRGGYYRDYGYRDYGYRGNPYRSGYRGYGRPGVYIGPGGAGIRF